ncbi:MAG: hypothetical protein ACXVB9_01735 [Bdellovibrionota bacterium]
MLTLVLSLLFSLPSFATTKGLSQIVTPDMQKPGDLSLSYQEQSRIIGNPHQLQAELGIVPWAEAAVFKGFDPAEVIFATEFSFLQTEPWLLSAGFLNLSTREGKMQPYLEGGYYTEHNKWIAGGVVVRSKAELLLGWAYDFDTHWRAQLDFQSGTENFSTTGFTYTLNDSFQFNPALYVSNDTDHQLAGYIVVTYTLKAWAPAQVPKPNAPKAM